MSNAIKNRYDFIIYFDVENGNPNGDPDAGNMPRIDPETGLGLVTDVCLKRKIRNYVEAVKEGEPGYRIYIKKGVPLNRSDNEAFEKVGISDAASVKKGEDLQKKLKEAKKNKEGEDADIIIRDYMCGEFFDIRTFGAVMTTMVKGALNCGQIRGPVQLSFSRSVDPIVQQEVSITRVAITTETDAERKSNEMGNKFIVPYGLYVCHGFISANLAKQTGFSEEDLALFWDALKNMFDVDRSAARGLMSAQKLIVFRHNSVLGNAPADKLFKLVEVKKKQDDAIPRSFEDYNVTCKADVEKKLEELHLNENITVEYLI